jgi:hypothetical protein
MWGIDVGHTFIASWSLKSELAQCQEQLIQLENTPVWHIRLEANQLIPGIAGRIVSHRALRFVFIVLQISLIIAVPLFISFIVMSWEGGAGGAETAMTRMVRRYTLHKMSYHKDIVYDIIYNVTYDMVYCMSI